VTASRGVQRHDGVPSLEWLFGQVTALPAPAGVSGGDCLLWQRSKTRDGYGKLCIGGKETGAHRVAYEMVYGPVACWLVLDHLCRRRDCINPAHLEAVTLAENTKRGNSRSALAARTGVCRSGHPLTASGGRMRCKVCLAARQREWYERKRAGGDSTSARRSA